MSEDYNFSWTFNQECRQDRNREAREYFRSEINYARQIAYQVTRGQSKSEDNMIPHKNLERCYDRRPVGIDLALVYLVGRLDHQLDQTFDELWERRRDRLTGWLMDNHKSETIRFEVKPNHLWFTEKSKWTVEDFFYLEVRNRWRRLSPWQKIKKMQKFLGSAPSEDTLKGVQGVIERRNEFCHPSPPPKYISSAARGVGATPRPLHEPPPSFDLEAGIEALYGFVGWLGEELHRAVNLWIAGNINNLAGSLSTSQARAFFTVWRYTDSHYQNWQTFTESLIERERKPDLLILGPTDELIQITAAVISFVKHQQLRLIIYEDPWHKAQSSEDITIFVDHFNQDSYFTEKTFCHVPANWEYKVNESKDWSKHDLQLAVRKLTGVQ